MYINNSKARIYSLIIAVAFLLTLPSALCAENGDLPLKNVSASEMQRLEAGERLFRVLDSAKQMRLTAAGPESSRLLEIVEDVDPNFLAEVIMYIPVDAERDNLAYIRDSLQTITDFDGIPYYSEEHEKTFPLFEDSEILSRSSSGNTEIITASHLMKPFKTHTSVYTLTREDDVFLFTGVNDSPIHYKNFKAVKEGNLLNLLWVQDRGDRLLIYGAGGAKAFTFFGLFGERMDNSFLGRVEAFFKWYYDEHARNLIKE